MAVWGLYGNKLAQTETEVIVKDTLLGHVVALLQAFAGNQPTTTTLADVSFFQVTLQSDIDRLEAGERAPFLWDVAAPNGVITGINWAYQDGTHLGVQAYQQSGEPANADGTIYLDNGDQTLVRFELWDLVDGIPDAVSATGGTHIIPFSVDGIVQKIMVPFTSGVSDADWLFKQHGHLGVGWQQLRVPSPGYKDDLFIVFVEDGRTPVRIQNVIDRLEIDNNPVAN